MSDVIQPTYLAIMWQSWCKRIKSQVKIDGWLHVVHNLFTLILNVISESYIVMIRVKKPIFSVETVIRGSMFWL